MIVLLVEVEAELFVPYKSTTRVAAIDGITVPSEVAPVALRVHVMLSLVDRLQDTFCAVPFWVMSEVSKLFEPTAAENITVKLAGEPTDSVLTGSAWPEALFTVTAKDAA